ncbi:MAG: signal peptidase I [Candidatus Daviesbacteria bacterium]|nr:signal peptidase I [Candidatus Daviesbacteria bacterium]
MEDAPISTDYYGEDKPSFWSNFKNNFAELLEFIAVLAAIFIFIRLVVAEPHKVSGRSMVPNFHDGDMLITNKLATSMSEPARGEVIILKSPRDNNVDFIKRIIGLPNEKIILSNGKVYINGQELKEPYLPDAIVTNGQSYLQDGVEVLVPEGQYFVIGDNRSGSSDSREWGPVKRELIIGQAYFRYWPIQKLTILQTGKASN